MNVEIYKEKINKPYGTIVNLPVTDYSQLMIVAFGGNAKEAGLEGQSIKAEKLEKIAIR